MGVAALDPSYVGYRCRIAVIAILRGHGLTNYRRILAPGATWFFTVNLAQRRSGLLVEHIDALRGALRYVQRRHPFIIEAMVILPDHLHAIWTLPPDDAGYPMRWRLFKSWFSARTGRRTKEFQPDRQRRTRHLAATLLGAYGSRRARLLPMRGLHPFQPGEARARCARRGLAIFHVSSLCRQRIAASGLGCNGRADHGIRRTLRFR